jgi:hypothetical protein
MAHRLAYRFKWMWTSSETCFLKGYKALSLQQTTLSKTFLTANRFRLSQVSNARTFQRSSNSSRAYVWMLKGSAVYFTHLRITLSLKYYLEIIVIFVKIATAR